MNVAALRIRPSDLGLLLVINLAWSLNFPIGKAGVTHFPPLLFTALRFGFLLALIFPWIRWISGKMRAVLVISSLFGVLHFGMIFVGLKASGDITSVAIVSQLYVPLSALFAVVVLGERLDIRSTLGIILALAGVIVVGFDPTVLQHFDGLAWMVGAAIVMAVATILMRRLEGVSVFELQAWISFVATPILLLLSLIFEQGQAAALQSATWWQFGCPFYSAVGASLVGHGLVYRLLTRYPVSVITPLLLPAPILAIGFGILFWDDQLTWKLVLGGLFMLASILILTVPSKKI